MYLRFVSPARVSARGYHSGLFQGACSIVDNADCPAYLRGAIQEERDWFNLNLDAPNDDI